MEAQENALNDMTKLDQVTIFAGTWFDKVNGNTYCACKIYLHGGNKSERIYAPFEYGYGRFWDQSALNAFLKHFGLERDRKGTAYLTTFLRNYGITCNTHLTEGMKQRDLKKLGGHGESPLND